MNNYRGYEPTSSAEYFKDLLLKEGYKIFEGDEYLTSKKCHHCEATLCATVCRDEEYKLKENMRLMRCTNSNCPYDTINRDKNAARNIARIGYEVFFLNRRPAYLRRPDKEDQNTAEQQLQ